MNSKQSKNIHSGSFSVMNKIKPHEQYELMKETI